MRASSKQSSSNIFVLKTKDNEIYPLDCQLTLSNLFNVELIFHSTRLFYLFSCLICIDE
jgi:hypothetical protein